MLDELELPTRLPDVLIGTESGAGATLLSSIHETRAAAAFYAPWCGPCQKELPQLAARIANDAQLLVIVSKDESVEETRRQLTNIGLSDVPFYVDVTGRLFEAARVTALPTTLLVTRGGAVLARGTGYSQLALRRLQRRATTPAGPGDSELPPGKTP
jgi:thiol-disulfide isomerase/thioredoxin